MKRITISGHLPFDHTHESQQFQAILAATKGAIPWIGEWAHLLVNFDYRHTELEEIPNDYDWGGQFDVILLAAHHAVIYEMKAKPAYVRGWTDGKDWEFRYFGTDHTVKERSCFDQVSKQRVFFLRNFLDKRRRELGVDLNMDFDVDARLLFPRTARLDVRSKVPADIDRDSFESSTLASIADEELREFLRKVYSREGANPSKLYLNIPLDGPAIRRIKKAFAASITPLRVERWFRALKTCDIRQDLVEASGSDRMSLSSEQANRVAELLGLPVVVDELV